MDRTTFPADLESARRLPALLLRYARQEALAIQIITKEHANLCMSRVRLAFIETPLS